MDAFNDEAMTTDRPGSSLTRGDGVSAWRQIADDIEGEIAAGALPAEAQLPTEAALALRFGVNRHTVRRALAALARKGLVRATRGRGTFVESRPLAYPISRRTRFSEIVARAGREAEGSLLAWREIASGPRLSEALDLTVGAPLLELTTGHAADGSPISTARTWLPLPRFGGFAAVYSELGSITRAFAAFGVPDYVRRGTRITARPATADEARVLELAPGRVVMVADSVNLDLDGLPIQATRSVFSADRVEFVIDS